MRDNDVLGMPGGLAVAEHLRRAGSGILDRNYQAGSEIDVAGVLTSSRGGYTVGHLQGVC